MNTKRIGNIGEAKTLCKFVEKGIPVYFNNKVKHITKKKNKFTLQTDSENFCCNKLILACGGKSAVKTGSDGSD